MIKTIYKLIILTVLCVFLYSGCNSAIYEIIEVEEPVEEIAEEKTTSEEITAVTEETKEEPKDEIKLESSITDNKFTDKQQIAKTYAIQLGAFNGEENASRLTINAAKRLSEYQVYYKDIEGLYKVRFGNYNNLDEAKILLEEIRQRGFKDSFIVELTYYKVDNK